DFFSFFTCSMSAVTRPANPLSSNSAHTTLIRIGQARDHALLDPGSALRFVRLHVSRNRLLPGVGDELLDAQVAKQALDFGNEFSQRLDSCCELVGQRYSRYDNSDDFDARYLRLFWKRRDSLYAL